MPVFRLSFSRRIVLIVALALSSLLAQHAGAATRYLLALSKTDHTLAIIDPITLKILDKLPVGPNPHEVVTSGDGRYAYVSNPGNNDLHEINVLDLIRRTVLPSFDTLPLLAPHGLHYLDGKLWFTAQGSKAVGRFDLRTNKLEWAMGTGQEFTHLIYVTPDSQAFYTTNAFSGTVSIFDRILQQPLIPASGKLPPTAKAHWDWEHHLVPVDTGSEGFDVAPDGGELWTVSPQGIISIIDPRHHKTIAILETGIAGAHRLKFTPDGRKVAIVSVKTGAVVYFDSSQRKEIARTTVSPGDTLLMDPIGNRLFVSCPLDNVVIVIDNTSMQPIAYLDVGGRPDGLAFAVIQDDLPAN